MRNLFVILFLFTASHASAQDYIFRVNPEKTIECKVVEIGEELVKYSTDEYSSNLTFAIDKNNITKIVFENGKTMEFSNLLLGAENYENQSKNAVKLGFFSPINSATTFYYERSIKPSQSIEFGLGYIGAGLDLDDDDPRGVVFRAGYKFITSPTWYDRRQRYSHILKGGYIKPELIITSFTARKPDFFSDEYIGAPGDRRSSERARATTATIMVIGGKQWILSNSFLVDFYGGIGYGFGYNPAEFGWHYSFIGLDGNTPIAITMELKIGFLWGK